MKKYVGVYKKGDKWCSSITYRAKCYHLGYCETQEEAAMLYDAARYTLKSDSQKLNYKKHKSLPKPKHDWSMVPAEIYHAIHNDPLYKINDEVYRECLGVPFFTETYPIKEQSKWIKKRFAKLQQNGDSRLYVPKARKRQIKRDEARLRKMNYHPNVIIAGTADKILRKKNV